MGNLKRSCIIAIILNLITMVGGIGLLTYYVNDLSIRGISLFVLIMSTVMIHRTLILPLKMKSIKEY